MRLTKREQLLLIILFFGVAAYAVYTYVVTPQLATLKEKQVLLQHWQLQKDELDKAPATLAQLASEHQNINTGIETIGLKHFSRLDEQEEVILLMNELFATPGIKDLSFSFAQLQPTEIAGGKAEAQVINVTFEASYQSLWALLRRIWAFDETIMVSNMALRPNANNANLFSGTVSLKLHDLSELTERHNSIIYWFNRENFIKENPFTPLPGQPFIGMRYFLASGSSDELPQYVKFADIGGHWAEEAIDTFGEQRLAFGDGNNRFYPDMPITRGELVVLLDGYFNWETPSDPVDLTRFSDYMDIGNYHTAMARAVFKGFLNGYIVGYGDGTLKPHAPVSYAEFNDIMSRILKEPGFTWETPATAIRTTTGHVSVGLTDISRAMTRAEAVYYLNMLPTN